MLGEKLFITRIYEGFTTRIEVSILLGVVFSIPFIVFEFLSFILPGLHRKERSTIILFLISSLGLFGGGVFLSMKLVLPWSIRFLKSGTFFIQSLNNVISYGSFLTFVSNFVLIFCAILQFPIVIMILLYFRIISTAFLAKSFKYFIPIALVAGAIIAPDIGSQLFLAVPFCLLYLFCILLGRTLKWGK
jgi:sec-independent protein translocase protein TatC